MKTTDFGLSGQWIEVFRAGDYEGKGAYTPADLDTMIANYDAAQHEAPIVIGHPELNAPAFGWVVALKREGSVLMAKLKQVQPEFEEMVKKGLFKKRSISFYTKPQLALRHVGFLGAAPPEIKGLADVQLSEGDFQAIEFKEEDTRMETGDIKKTFVETLKEFFKDFKLGGEGGIHNAPKTFTEAEAKEQITAAVAEVTKAFEKKFNEISTQVADQAKHATAAAQTGKAAEIIGALKSKGKWIPAFDKMKLGEIFGELVKSEATVEFGEGDKKTQKPVAQVLADFMEGLQQIVPAKELTAGGKAAGKLLRFNESKGVELNEDSVDLLERAKKIEIEKKVSFGEALKIARAEAPTTEGSAAANAV